jgi:hypothetical protein
VIAAATNKKRFGSVDPGLFIGPSGAAGDFLRDMPFITFRPAEATAASPVSPGDADYGTSGSSIARCSLDWLGNLAVSVSLWH